MTLHQKKLEMKKLRASLDYFAHYNYSRERSVTRLSPLAAGKQFGNRGAEDLRTQFKAGCFQSG